MSGEGSNFDPAAIAQGQLEQLKIQEEKAKKEKEIAEALGNQLEAAKKLIEVERMKLNAAIKNLELKRDEKDFTESMLLSQGKATEEFKKFLGEQELSAKQQEKLIRAIEAGNGGIDDAINKMKEFRAQQELSKDFARDIERSTGNLAKKMGIAADFSKTGAGHMAEMANKFLNSDTELSIQSITGAFEGLVSPLNMIGSLLDIAITKMLELNKAGIELKISTGYINDFQAEMTSLAAETSKFGIKMSESNKALSSVYKNINGINLELPGLAKNFANTASQLTKLGVASDITSKNQSLLLKTFKMSGPQIDNILKDMAGSADALGLTSEQMSSQFQSTMGYLSSFGKEGVQSFKNLAAQAGVTGVAISKMLDITKAFDKFSEGAKKAAKLNSVLGTSLSSMALMTMDPAQRMNELRTQIQQATGGVNNMTQAQKLFTAEAMGYTNVAEMMADLQADPAKLQQQADIAERRANIQERMNNAMTELLPLMDRVSMAFESLATNEKLINGLAFAAEFLADSISFIVRNFEILAFVTTGLSAAFTIFKLKALEAAVVQSGGAVSSALLAAKEGFLDMVMMKSTATMNVKTLALYNYNRAQMMAMGKMMLFITAIGVLIYYLTKPNSPPLYLIFGVIAVGVLFFGRALDSMGPKAIIAALALALLAGAISLIFYGMAALVESITGLFTVLMGAIDTLPVLAMNMYMLGSAFLYLGASAMFGSYGIFMGLAGLTALFLLFKVTGASMKDMFGAGEEVFKIGAGIEKFAGGLASIKSTIAELKSSIGSDQLMAASLTGESSSIVMGKNVAVASLFKNTKIEVDVKMPEVSMPNVEVKVYIGNEELRNIVRQEITKGQR